MRGVATGFGATSDPTPKPLGCSQYTPKVRPSQGCSHEEQEFWSILPRNPAKFLWFNRDFEVAPKITVLHRRFTNLVLPGRKQSKFFFVGAVRIFIIVARCSKCDRKFFVEKKNPKTFVEKIGRNVWLVGNIV